MTTPAPDLCLRHLLLHGSRFSFQAQIPHMGHGEGSGRQLREEQHAQGRLFALLCWHVQKSLKLPFNYSPVWHVEGFYYQESQSVPEGWEIHFITPCSSSNRTKSTVDFPTSFTVHKETKLLPFYNKKEGVSTVGSNKNWPCGLAHVFFFFFFYFVMGQVGLVVLQDLWKFNVLFNCNEI